ncbi:MAG: hypothetical protein Q9220_001468 [cf. Caloplaca sp. 1 TL-2023]
MSEKRKPTTRYQGERPPKRRQLSASPPPPPPPPAPKERANKDGANGNKEEPPSKAKDDQILPIRSEKQDASLSNSKYQSIAESGILAHSIQQSRQRWATDGIFERYWARPSKKKAQADAHNPAKETMVKLGACSMVIEPHVFETTLYTVREYQSVFMPSQPPPPPPPRPPNPAYNPYQDHKTYQPQVHSSYSHTNYPQYHSQYQSNSSSLTLPPFREGFGQYSPPGPPVNRDAVPPRSMERSQSKETGPPPGTDAEATANESEKPTDPVIQMLATRAASDHNLKALMKVVASGHASQEQLRDFQNHIDELNSLIKNQKSPTQPINDQQTRSPASHSHTYPSAPTPTMPRPPTQASSTSYTYHPPAPIRVKAESQTPTQYYSPHAPPPRRAAAPGPPKSDIVAVVFDFGPTGDRFSFPRFTILEYLPGRTQVIASFLAIRKGNEAATAHEYNKHTTYYQPVTVRLSAANPKYLEPLEKVVAPQDEVRRYMNGIFDKMSPAKPAFLMTRLPKVKEDGDTEMEEAVTQPNESLIKRTYSPPNSLVPLAV